MSTLALLKKLTNNNKIRCKTYPLPIISNNINKFFNVNTGSAITDIKNNNG